MPMSIEELEQRYRRAYRRLSLVIGLVYGIAVLAGLAAVAGNARLAGWTSGILRVSEPIGSAQPMKRIHTVNNE
jgi:hypothetical protein